MKNLKKLTILHSNDMHGDFLEEEIDEAGGWCVTTLRLCQQGPPGGAECDLCRRGRYVPWQCHRFGV